MESLPIPFPNAQLKPIGQICTGYKKSKFFVSSQYSLESTASHVFCVNHYIQFVEDHRLFVYLLLMLIYIQTPWHGRSLTLFMV